MNVEMQWSEKSDEEFPPCLKVMWDENVLDFIKYETTYYVLDYLLERIKKEMVDEGESL